MLLRRTTPLALAIAALACEPSVPFDTTAHNPTAVDYAAFDPQGIPPAIPLPNDLALLPEAIATQNPAQAALLNEFAAAGGFPNDQEVPITIDFVRETINPDTGAVTRTAPTVDTATVTTSTLALISISTSGFSVVPYDQPTAADYKINGDHGTLTIHNKVAAANGSRRWPPGQYVVAVRGGDNGVKLLSPASGGLQPQPTMYLLTHCCKPGTDFTSPENQGIIPGATRADKATAAARLEALRKNYVLPFAAIDSKAAFKHVEIATMGTFKIADVHTHVETDPGAGLMPLPSDFLLDPTSATPKVANIPAFGPAAAGLATLDGFSTTAMILSQTSGLIDATTVNKGTVFLYEYSSTTPGVVTRMLEIGEAGAAGRFLAEPPAITQVPPGATKPVSTAIGLQPAYPIPVAPVASPPPLPAIPLPALKENTEYAVVITNLVKDISGSPLTRSTLGKLLMFSTPLTSGGKSQLAGVDDATAGGVEKMRLALQPVIAKLAADKSITKDQIAMAYTFKTQSITGTAVQLAALPYSTQFAAACTAAGLNCANPFPGATVISATPPTVRDVFDKYGVDPALPTASIDKIIETKIVTLNLLDPATGAFNPDPTKGAAEVIDVLIAVPASTNTNVPTCAGALAALAPAKCPQLIVFHHGLGASRTSVLLAANNLTAKGFVVAAIDAPKHGSRTFCSQLNIIPLSSPPTNAGPDVQCLPPAHCVIEPTLAGQGDPAAAGSLPAGTPGRCRTGTTTADPPAPMLNRPTLCITGTCTFTTANPGFPAASGQFLISANFFRTRDSLRQTLIDESQLIRVLEPTPTGAPITGADVYNALLGVAAIQTLFINPFNTGWVGQSLGSLIGTMNVAANPRINRAVLNAGGGTIVDIFTNAPSFRSGVDALFLALGIDRSKIASDPAVAGAYLRTLSVAKWILDPADPINYSGHITDAANTLPNLLPPLGGAVDGSVKQSAKLVLGQNAFCDRTVPNNFNAQLETTMGILAAPVVPPATSGTGFTQWYRNINAAADPDPAVQCPAGLAVPHSFLTNFGAGSAVADQPTIATLTDAAQNNAADFISSGTAQITLVSAPAP